MNADCKGALAQLNNSWKAFMHKGKSMSKAEVKAVLQYAISKGYEHTGMLSDEEVDNILQQINPIPMANEPTITAVEYTKRLEYLPDFMRDFHDQKDIFKAIHQLYANNESLQKMPNSWCDNHVFVIDYFLWFMGQHGYKLQRVKKKGVEFCDLKETIEKMLNQRNSGLIEILKQHEKPTTNE